MPGAPLVLLTCFAVPAWTQESAALKRIRIGMTSRGVTTLGLTAAQAHGLFAHRDFMPN